MAHAAYLSGISSTIELCSIANCSYVTITRWLKEWQDERLKHLATMKLRSLSLDVTSVEIDEHYHYVCRLRELCSTLSEEIKESNKIVESLQNVVTMLERHPDFEQRDFKQVCSALSSYAHANNARSKLQSDYIKANKELHTETGLRAYHDAASGRIKEVERRRGRNDADLERKDLGLTDTKDPKSSGFFEASDD